MGSAEKLKKNQEKTSPQPVNAQLVPNVTTWIAAGIGGVAVLVMVIITICVSRRKKVGVLNFFYHFLPKSLITQELGLTV